MATCQFCNSSNVKQLAIQHFSVLECQLCGEYTGSADAIQLMHDRREARERHLDPDVFPLVKLLERIDGITVNSASRGDADLLLPPYAAFQLRDAAALRGMEKLLQALAFINERLKTRWIVQATILHRQLTFELKPDFSVLVHSLNRYDLKAAVDDMPILIQSLENQMQLAWWKQA